MHQLVLLVSDPETRALFEQWLAEHPMTGRGRAAGEHAATDGPGIKIHIVDALADLDAGHAAGHDGPAPSPLLFLLSQHSDPQDRFATGPSTATQQRIVALAALLRTQQEQLLHVYKAIENTGEALSIADVNGLSLYHNNAFIDLYGYTVNELNQSGVPDTLFVNPAIAHDIFETTQRGQSWQGDALLRTKDNRVVPAYIRADSIEDDHHQRIGSVIVYTDIADRKRADMLYREQQVMAEALRDTAAAITSTLNLDEVLDRILSNIKRVVPHDSAYVLLLEDGALSVARKRGTTSDISDTARNAACPVCDPDELAYMAETGEAVIGTRGPAHHPAKGTHAEPAMRSYIGVPVTIRGTAIGFIYLLSEQPDFFSASHERHLQLFAEQAAIALHNAQAHEKAKRLASLEERQRLARDLHDAVSQTLFSASVIAESLPVLWRRKPDMVADQLKQLHRLTRGALAEMRSLLLELRPAAMMEARLGQLLKQLTDALQGRTHIETTLKIEGERDLPENVQKTLYYIAQEALNNVVKHANASRVYVRLRNLPDRVELAIHDDGVGFAPSDRGATSLGLGIMRERAQAIDAEIAIHSQPGKGTLVLLTWTNKGA